jgi:ubiquinone/menaquinone biosynthesis C-methylase UbiE
MQKILSRLQACAEPTRLRLLALASRGSFCVVDFTEILGQSQPRLSRHLRLLVEAGLLERSREGSNVRFSLAPSASEGGSLARAAIERLPEDDPLLAADRRQAARVLAEHARQASESFRAKGADWDEMRALDLPAAEVEAALQALLPQGPIANLLDIGTGTGRLLELLAPRVQAGLGIDASRAMLALARARLSRPGLTHCTTRLGDMYRLPLADRGFDVVVLQMVLHHAEDPDAALEEAARVVRPGGRLVVVDFAPHAHMELHDLHAHRWPGFADAGMAAMFARSGLTPGAPRTVPGRIEIRLWPADRPAAPLALEVTS